MKFDAITLLIIGILMIYTAIFNKKWKIGMYPYNKMSESSRRIFDVVFGLICVYVAFVLFIRND
jgi:cell division protein FtsW (lipid II flippase)